MKSIDELTHYELLEIGLSATPGELDRAYRIAQQTYAEGSLALYSVFEGRDAAGIRAQLDEAYRVLADPETRALYDEAIAKEEPTPALLPVGASIAPLTPPEHASPLGWDPVPSKSDRRDTDPVDEFADDPMDFEAFDEHEGGDFDGTRLRKTRLFRGYELEDITDVTKVSPAHLRNIEEENFGALPADVYVRGFVTAYAKTIGLDPTLVVPSYMQRLAESREPGTRGRFMSRR